MLLEPGAGIYHTAANATNICHGHIHHCCISVTIYSSALCQMRGWYDQVIWLYLSRMTRRIDFILKRRVYLYSLNHISAQLEVKFIFQHDITKIGWFIHNQRPVPVRKSCITFRCNDLNPKLCILLILMLTPSKMIVFHLCLPLHIWIKLYENIYPSEECYRNTEMCLPSSDICKNLPIQSPLNCTTASNMYISSYTKNISHVSTVTVRCYMYANIIHNVVSMATVTRNIFRW